jgi:hypothetical protein
MIKYRRLGVTRTDPVAFPQTLRVPAPPACPELATTTADSAGGPTGIIDANVRFTLPDYRLWMSNWGDRALNACVVDLDGGPRAGGVRARIRHLGANRPVLLDAAAFTDARGAPWQPADHPPHAYRIRCAGTGDMTGSIGRRR